MRYDEIITEANYKSKFDSTKIYPSQAEFKKAVASQFGVSDATKESKPQAGGAVYILSPSKGVVGYKVPNNDSAEGFVWYAAKEPFMPASKKKADTPAPVAKAAPQAAAPVAKPAPKTVDVPEALSSLLNYVKSVDARNMWGGYDVRGPEQNGDDWVAEIRHWGNWQVPYGEEDDGDYDWEELTPESGAKLQKIVDEYSKRYPGVAFEWNTGEKNWIFFYARAK